jgi:hypothetical protein
MKYDRANIRRQKNQINGVYEDDHIFEMDDYKSVEKRITMEEERLSRIYKLTCDIIGTTDGKSLKMLNEFAWNRGIHTLLPTLSFPIYHIEFYEEYDMGYNYYGERAPYIDSIETQIWTVIDKKPTLFTWFSPSYTSMLCKPSNGKSYNTIKNDKEIYNNMNDEDILYSIRRKINLNHT